MKTRAILRDYIKHFSRNTNSYRANISLFLALFILPSGIIISKSLYAFDYLQSQGKVKEIAEFLKVKPSDLSIECPQGTYGFEGTGKEKSLFLCISPVKQEKRCEVALSILDEPPAMYNLSFEIKESSESPSDRWHSIMQIHSFPDFGEKWRCPPLSVEISKGSFRAYSRTDSSKISKTYGYNCAESGSSISSNTIVNNAQFNYDKWNALSMRMKASYDKSGYLLLSLNQTSSELRNRGNLYNDRKPPYIKLGIYKPAGWSKFEIDKGKPVCASYRNFEFSSSEIE